MLVRKLISLLVLLVIVLVPSLALAAGSLVGWGADVFVEQSKLEGFPSDWRIGRLSAGAMHSAAVRPDGSIVVFGDNDDGQCNVPEPNSNFTRVAAGDYFTVGLKADGSLVAWGRNDFGQCNIPLPNDYLEITAGASHCVAVRRPAGAIAWGCNLDHQCDLPESSLCEVAAGGDHNIAYGRVHPAACWGSNAHGESNPPLAASNLREKAAGKYHTLCVDYYTGAIHAWGDNFYGQCNVPAPNNFFFNCAGGGYHSLGLRGSSIVAWGDNRYGQCNVPTPNNYYGFAAGQAHSLALRRDPPTPLLAWGANERSQCNVPAPNTGFVAFATGQEHHLGLRSTGVVAAWGKNALGQCTVPAPNSGFTRLAAGDFHSLGIKTTGVMYAWGDNKNHQCDIPAPNTNFVSVSAGKQFSLGLKATGVLSAFGLNDEHQCDVPAPNSGFTAISAGWEHGLGLKTTGAVVAWGRDNYRQCTVPAGTNFAQVAAGGYHSLALRRDGSIAAWGCNTYGQCNVPLPNSNFAGIAAGMWFSVGLKTDGSIVVWGRDNRSVLRTPRPNSGFVAVTACYDQGMALKGPGTPGASLHMTLGPPGAVTSGAAWRLYGSETWRESGFTETGIPPGMCAVEFRDVGIGKVPENMAIAIEEGKTTEAFAEYNWPDVPPDNIALSPSSGDLTAATVTLTAQYGDGNGFDNIRRAYLLINDSLGQSNAACMVYDRPANKLYLKDDAGKSWGLGYAPGTAMTLENSQCLVYVKDTIVSADGADLVVNWSVSFKSDFSKRLLNGYEYVQDADGLSDGWDLLARYYNARPQLVSITPNSGPLPIDAHTTITSVYRAPNGFSDLRKCYLLLSESLAQSNAVFLCYDKAANKVYLKNDTNTSWGTGYAPATDVTLENSQCVVFVKDILVSGSADDLTITWAFKLKPSMTDRSLFSWMYVSDARGAYDGWRKMGTHFKPLPPVCVSLSPNKGDVAVGAPLVLSAVYGDPNGYQDIAKCYLQLSVTSSWVNGIFAIYSAQQNRIFLRNDASSSWGTGYAPGTAATLENSQCIINVADTTVTPDGPNNLRIDWNITLKPSQSGLTLTERTCVVDNEGLNSGFQMMGTVTAH